jgi:hypothetical protein
MESGRVDQVRASDRAELVVAEQDEERLRAYLGAQAEPVE